MATWIGLSCVLVLPVLLLIHVGQRQKTRELEKAAEEMNR